MWPAEPHTLAKIAILQAYLLAWFSIMGRTMRKLPLLYIDGFAGPGEYTNSAKGSPRAALQAARAARARTGHDWTAGAIHCAFMESNAERCAHLAKCVDPYKSEPGVKVHVYPATFLEGLRRFQDEVPSAFSSQWPRFVFLDPFGATGVPFATVQELLNSPRAEVLINLDANGIQRILQAGQAASHDVNLTTTFGDGSWRTAIDSTANSAIQHVQVLQLYKARLRSIPNVQYAWAFEMATRADRLEYFLVFASQHPRGLEKMKEAMKRIAQGGDYRFSDRREQQPELELFRSDDPVPWSERLRDVYRNLEATYAELRDYALNETPFLNPKSMLKCLASRNLIEAIPREGAKLVSGTFPEEKIDRIRFV
jgi:three-Cys-motif partner protein